MKRLLLMTVMLLSFFPRMSYTSTLDRVTSAVKHIYDTGWIQQQTLYWGQVGSFCVYQGLTGLTEGYHFGQEEKHIVSSQDYHAWATAQRSAGIVTGWFSYANFKNTEKNWKQKAWLGVHALAWGRNSMEWSYKLQRYGDSFDYTREHNRSAIMLFTLKKWRVKDVKISTGPVTGPMVDIGFFALGLFAHRMANF